jgi:hypothetical protein
MPILPEHEEMLKNAFADTSSTGGSRYAGASTAAAFLQKFVADGVKWAHIDIAGPAMYSKVSCSPFPSFSHLSKGPEPFSARRDRLRRAAYYSVSAVFGHIVICLCFFFPNLTSLSFLLARKPRIIRVLLLLFNPRTFSITLFTYESC